MPTLNDVAKEAGVSTSTASRTFNTPHLIHDETRKRVLEAAALLNYQPPIHKLSRGAGAFPRLRKGSDVIGFQFFSCFDGDSVRDNLFYAPLLAGAQSEANKLGLNLLIGQTSRHEIEERLPRMIRDRSVSGMMLVGTADSDILNTFQRLVRHIVLVDQPDSDGRHDSILSDGFTGALKTTRYLMGMGHKRIGFLLDDDVPNFWERYHGYVCAHYEAGIASDPSLFLGPSQEHDFETRLRQFLLKQKPTAVVAENDNLALTAMKVCHELGISIPGDMSIAGFDDIEFSTHAYPPLTTVRVDKEYLGRLAVRRLHFRITESGSNIEPPILIKTPVSLVIRKSCASPR